MEIKKAKNLTCKKATGSIKRYELCKKLYRYRITSQNKNMKRVYSLTYHANNKGKK